MLLPIISAAIVSLAPHLLPETVERYASDIEKAADDDIEMALALVATQDAESNWRLSVETCKVTGDAGLALTAFQLHKHWLGGYSARAVCTSNTLAASLAASALTVLSHRTGDIRSAMTAYVGCRAKDPRSVKRLANYDKLVVLAREAGLS